MSIDCTFSLSSKSAACNTFFALALLPFISSLGQPDAEANMADPGTERSLPAEDMPRLGPTWSRGGGMFKPPKRPEGHPPEGVSESVLYSTGNGEGGQVRESPIVQSGGDRSFS